MKTVFIVIGWYIGEEDFISGIFENEGSACTYAASIESTDEYNYQYRVEEWELR